MSTLECVVCGCEAFVHDDGLIHCGYCDRLEIDCNCRKTRNKILEENIELTAIKAIDYFRLTLDNKDIIMNSFSFYDRIVITLSLFNTRFSGNYMELIYDRINELLGD